MAYIAGQRYINSADLQLGLGRVIAENHRMVKIAFDAIEEERIYAKETAPLTRFVLNVGDKVKHKDGWEITIQEVKELNGLTIYFGSTASGDDEVLPETEIANTISLDRPAERLFSGQIDKYAWFRLRQRARVHQHRLKRSKVYGLSGCRTALLPHQLYIAQTVGKRFAPRVLLADEVGLGKTIEAGLIIHQQLLTNRASRVLIVVPDSLVHQWLVELIRRFNLSFSVFDEEKTQQIESSTDGNPFESTQLALLPMSLLSNSEQRVNQALQAKWDILVVDEAHHLQWQEDNSSKEYSLVESLAASTPGVLLLTATPEQLGKKSHFARLRLLDRDKYHSYDQFLKEESQFAPIAGLIAALLNKTEVETAISSLAPAIQKDEYFKNNLKILTDKKADEEAVESARQLLVDYLLDHHGTGRILFRNTRQSVSGFPNRELHQYALEMPSEYQSILHNDSSVEQLYPELLYQQQTGNGKPEAWLGIDPRAHWLVDRIKQLKPEKLLIIASAAQSVLQIEAWLREKHGIHAAVFHEGMNLIERDQAAAWFADEDNGSQLLVCSEIGSEGRNFQFAHHLLLFDLPAHPDLLEQRIGRLDRIGQKQTIELHVPYIKGSLQERLFVWYHQALNIFNQTNPAAASVYAECEAELFSDTALDDLIDTTKEKVDSLLLLMKEGRDRLLEYNSCRPQAAMDLVNSAEKLSDPFALMRFMHNAFDLFGVHYEEHRSKSEIIRPTDEMDGYFPFLLEEGMTITYDRETALANENMHFITWEHPMVTELLELISGQEKGNTSLIALKGSGLSAGQMFAEIQFNVEALGHHGLQLSRYLPSLDQRFVMSETGLDIASKLTRELLQKLLFKVPPNVALEILKSQLSAVKNCVKHGEELMLKKLPEIIEQAKDKLNITMSEEIKRLESLAEKNSSIRSEEIEHLISMHATSLKLLEETQPQLDSIRIIVTM